MDRKTKLTIVASGTFSLLLGTMVLVGWAFLISPLVKIYSSFTPMVIGTAICFVLAGFALLLSKLQKPSLNYLIRLFVIVIAIIASLFLLEHIAGINLFVDLSDIHRSLSNLPRPGRMAMNTAIAFLLFCIGMLILLHNPSLKIQRILCSISSYLALLVICIALLGLLGYLIHLGQLYAWSSKNKMAAHTTIGLLVLGYGLWTLSQYKLKEISTTPEKNKILTTSFAMMVMISLITSVASIATLEQLIENSIANNYKTKVEDQSALFYQIILHRSQRALVLSKNQALVNAISAWYQHPENKSLLKELQQIADSYKANGFNSISVQLITGQNFVSTPIKPNSLSVNLKGIVGGQLEWQKGYYLRLSIPVISAGATIATITTYQSIPVLNQLLPNVIKQGKSDDLTICGSIGADLLCFPNRFNKAPYRVPKILNGNYIPAALSIEQKVPEVKKTVDYRNIAVLAAYGQIGDTGLGMGQKVDLEQIYTPIKKSFQLLVGITLLLLGLSYYLVRKSVKPLVAKIVAAQKTADIENQRFIAATESGIDNFYIFEAVRDAQNEIIDFRCLYINSAGSKLINKAPGEMVGKLLLKEVPIHRKKRIFDKYKYVIETGKPISEEFAIDDKDINTGWMYSQITKLGDGMAITTRDITERKRLENEVVIAAKLNSTILNSASYSIISVDKNGMIVSMNKAAQRMLWYSELELVGKSNFAILHDKEEIVLRAKSLSEELGRVIEPGFEVFIAKSNEDIPYEEEWHYVRKDGSQFPVKLSVTMLRDANKEIYGYLGIAYDISAEKRREEYIKHIALHDVLTGLPNRALYDDRAKMAIESGKRTNSKVGIALLDLDHFKHINDSLGHHIGDELLKETSIRLLECIRPTDTVARMGGDEFAFIFPNITDAKFGETILSKIHQVFKEKMEFNEHIFFITSSIGMAIYPDDGLEIEALLRNADAAMYRAKELGRDGYKIFTKEMLDIASKRVALESKLRQAIDEEQFELFYQPQISLNTMTIVGVEALIRWQTSPGSYLSPVEFIPVAEETGLIVPIGEWVIRTAIKQAKLFEIKFGRPIRMAINVSPRQFRQKNLITKILDCLTEFNVAPENIEIEITESLMMDDIEAAIEVQEKLHAAGVKIAIDDFGTGYSSLSYISKFKFDRIKIDQSFIKNCLNNPEDASLVKTIISMSKSLDIEIIAEGVETIEQLNFIKSHHCDEAQGYFIVRPMPAADLLHINIDTLVKKVSEVEQ